MSQWDFGGPPAGGHEYDEYGEYRGFRDAATSDEFEGGEFSPVSYERDPYPEPGTARWAGQWPFDEPHQHTAPLPAPPHPTSRAGELWPDESWPPRTVPRHARRRWLIPCVVVAVAAAAAGVTVVLLGGHPAGRTAGTGPTAPGVTARPSTQPAPRTTAQQPLTLAQARQVLARYTTHNNQANARMSDAMLATIETGSSYSIDAGVYRVQQAEQDKPYAAFGPQQATFYVPRQSPAVYPHWFAVQVVNASLASPSKSTGTEYLVFTQAAPGKPWLNTVEPYVVGGATPPIAIGADGLATPVSPSATSLAVQPSRIAALTAAALDGGPGVQGGPPGALDPPNLADRLDEGFWRKQIPAATVTDSHAAAPGAQVFGLATAGGGALLFYTDAAELTLAPPAGEALHLTIPGFYSPSQALTSAGVGYLEQFATYVPPRGGSGMRVVADYSGITARNLSRTRRAVSGRVAVLPAGSANELEPRPGRIGGPGQPSVRRVLGRLGHRAAQLRDRGEGRVGVGDLDVHPPEVRLGGGQETGRVHDPGDRLPVCLQRGEPELVGVTRDYPVPAEHVMVERDSPGVVPGQQLEVGRRPRLVERADPGELLGLPEADPRAGGVVHDGLDAEVGDVHRPVAQGAAVRDSGFDGALGVFHG